MKETEFENDCYLNQKESAKYLGIAKVTLIKWRKKYKDFPKNYRLSESAVFFKKSELDEWMEKRREA
jgi:predicted DNA-binding transcriptional regulator AlpA